MAKSETEETSRIQNFLSLEHPLIFLMKTDVPSFDFHKLNLILLNSVHQWKIFTVNLRICKFKGTVPKVLRAPPSPSLYLQKEAGLFFQQEVFIVSRFVVTWTDSGHNLRFATQSYRLAMYVLKQENGRTKGGWFEIRICVHIADECRRTIFVY